MCPTCDQYPQSARTAEERVRSRLQMCPVNRILCGARRLTSIIAHQIHPCCRNVSDQPARCRSRPLQTSDTPTPISDTPLGTHIRQSIQPQPSSPMQSSSMRRGAAFIVLGLLVNFAAARYVEITHLSHTQNINDAT